MDEPKNRRTDQQGPKTPLRWGERWTLLLTSPTSGIVGQYGATWPGQPAHYERVNVYAEGAAKLDDIEQYRLQMAAIGTASFGYWKEGDSIHPDYDTAPLRDVARLYAKYAELHAFRESVLNMTPGEIPPGMDEVEYWKRYAAGEKACNERLKAELAGEAGRRQELLDTLIEKFEGWADASGDRAAHEQRDVLCCENSRANAIYSCVETLKEMHPAYAKKQAAPDAVDAAMADAIMHGTGAFRVNGDGSTERVDWQRDALHPGYAAPKQDGDK